MHSSASILFAMLSGILISACGPAESEKSAFPSESAPSELQQPEPEQELFGDREWQIVREDGLRVKLSESAQSAKACSDALLKEVDYAGEQLMQMESWVAEMKSNNDPGRIEEIQQEKTALEMKVVAQKFRRQTLCESDEMGMLTVGTRISVFEETQQCAPSMMRIEVLMGNNAGRIGCVHSENVEEIVTGDQ